MRIRIYRQEINRILGGKYGSLHREFLGMDISGRRIDPIDRNVFYVSYKDPVGWNMFQSDAPALCDFRKGFIYCYHDQGLPLTEPRLVHEFVHRAARFQLSIGVWSSGVLVNEAWSRVNEALTEYLTSLICGEQYDRLKNPENRYLIYLPVVREVEKEMGRDALVRAYMDHDVRKLEPFITLAGNSGKFRFK